MKILFTSDIHANENHLFSMLLTAEKEKADAVIIGGDIVPHNLPHTDGMDIVGLQSKYLRDVFLPAVENFRQKRNIPVYLDLANDDFIAARKILEKYDGKLFSLLHERKHKLTETVDIIGYMNVPITPFGIKDWEKPDAADQPYAPGNAISLNGCVSVNGMLEKTVIDLASEDTIENDLARLSETIDRPFIFVSHAPPYQTPLDVLYDGTHVGSLSIRRFIEKWSEKGHLIASLHGHIHESPARSGSIRTEIGTSLCINPGQDSRRIAVFQYVIFKLTDTEKRPTVQML
ncbi:MAG: hypothetical protein DRI57_14930 [Deltaproteobacteria bacterium]|nr:MAG: hypothetical protein DRI57_14930 [Deltaproteobacteria bacterium]